MYFGCVVFVEGFLWVFVIHHPVENWRVVGCWVMIVDPDFFCWSGGLIIFVKNCGGWLRGFQYMRAKNVSSLNLDQVPFTYLLQISVRMFLFLLPCQRQDKQGEDLLTPSSCWPQSGWVRKNMQPTKAFLPRLSVQPAVWCFILAPFEKPAGFDPIDVRILADIVGNCDALVLRCPKKKIGVMLCVVLELDFVVGYWRCLVCAS